MTATAPARFSTGYRPGPPFFSGAGSTALAPFPYPVAIAGHPYIVELATGEFRRTFQPRLRMSWDTNTDPDEGSLATDGAWRRTQTSWHRGAGQTWADSKTSDPYCFRKSKGVDVWTRHQATLLPATTQLRASANTNLAMCNAGGRFYLTDGTGVLYATTLSAPSWTAVTGTPGVNATAICSDGFDVFTAHGASGIYKTDTGSGASASYVTGTIPWCAFVKGRLLCSSGAAIYNPTAGGALPTAIYTHPAPQWTWTAAAAGRSHIFVAGYAGDQSAIYRIGLISTGTTLDVPQVALELPAGEVVRSLTGYLGFLIIGTDKGFRFADTDSSGNLSVGIRTDTAAAVLCAAGYGRFVWVGYSNFDGTSTGLARLDPSELVSTATPAWAPDVYADVQGAVTSVIVFGGQRAFAVSGQGIYGEVNGTYVASGTIWSGRWRYGLADPKLAVGVDVRCKTTGGTVSMSVDGEDATGGTLGTLDTSSGNVASWTPGGRQGDWFETVTVMTGGAATATLHSIMLRAVAVPTRNQIVQVPIILASSVTLGSVVEPFDVDAELAFLSSLVASAQVVTYQEGALSLACVVDNLEWRVQRARAIPHDPGFEGVALVTLRTV